MSHPISKASGALADDTLTELYDADIPRVDLVGKAANGRTFALMKSAGGNLLSPAAVEALIKESETNMADEVTQDEAVSKADDEIEISTDLDVTEPLANSEDPLANAPASPEWEQVDADTAQKWIAILSRAKYAIGDVLAGREGVEAASPDGSWEDSDNQWNLQDAACAIDYAIGVLAVYAAGEQMEADGFADLTKSIAEVVKALSATDLAVAEGLAPVFKAGRVLSSANENLLRAAIESITKVLASLPAAPDDEGDAVTKDEIEKTDESAVAAGDAAPEAAVEKADEPEVVKAAGDPMQAVFDGDGNLVGVVDPTKIVPIAGGGSPDKADADASNPDDETPGDVDPNTIDQAAAPAAAAGVSGATPAVPADNDVQKTESAVDAPEEVTKESGEELSNAELTALVKAQAAEIELLKSPAPPKVLLNGKRPQPQEDHLRGLAAPAAATDPDVLRKALDDASTPQEQEAIRKEMNEQAAAMLAQIHGSRPPRAMHTPGA